MPGFEYGRVTQGYTRVMQVSKYATVWLNISEKNVNISLFYIKITTSVTRSSYHDRGLCYLHLPIFSHTYNLLFCRKVKLCCDHCFL